MIDKPFKANRLPVIHLRVFLRMQIEHAKPFILNVDDIRIQIIWRRHSLAVILRGAVIVFKVDGRTDIHAADIAAADQFPRLLGCPVEHDHVGGGDMLNHALSHVHGIQLKGFRIDGRDQLIHFHHPGQIAKCRVQVPHAVHFKDHPVRMMTLYKGIQQLRVKLVLILHVFHFRVRLFEHCRFEFFHPLLTLNHQGVLIPGKSGILEDTCYKRCFSALKKAGKNVYRNCHCLPPLRLHRTALPASPHSDSIRSRTDVR